MQHSPEFGPRQEISEDEIVSFLIEQTKSETLAVTTEGKPLLDTPIAELLAGNANAVTNYLENEIRDARELAASEIDPASDESVENQQVFKQYQQELAEKMEKYVAFLKERYPSMAK